MNDLVKVSPSISVPESCFDFDFNVFKMLKLFTCNFVICKSYCFVINHMYYHSNIGGSKIFFMFLKEASCDFI